VRFLFLSSFEVRPVALRLLDILVLPLFRAPAEQNVFINVAPQLDHSFYSNAFVTNIRHLKRFGHREMRRYFLKAEHARKDSNPFRYAIVRGSIPRMYTVPMSGKLPLNEMTIREKLAMMETLWDELSNTPGAIESPDWHAAILEERQKKIDDGTARFKDWKTAKSDIRKKSQ
jgi:hypothetical protein